MEEYNTHIYSEGDPEFGTWKDDWRLGGSAFRLLEKHLLHRTFERTISIEDYDTCDLCYERFDDEDPVHPKKAYYCPTEHCWICEACFQDFKEHFHWTADEVQEDLQFDPLSRLTMAFRSIVDSDPRPIIVCSCQHIVYYMNEAATCYFSNNIVIGAWWGSAYQNKEAVWNEIKLRFDYLLQHADICKLPEIHSGNERIDMTALRNNRGELIGYFLITMPSNSDSPFLPPMPGAIL